MPRLALIAEGFTDAAVAERTAEAVRAGAPWVQLRDHPASEVAFAEAARALAERLRQETPDVLISINSRPGVAEMIGAGLHTGRHGPSVKEAQERLPEDALVGASAHDAGEARAAAGADYLFFSPVFPTSSKPDHPGAGLDALQSFCETFSNTPVLALGGIPPERTAPCRAAGAHGVAVRSGILHALRRA
ncbi:MAG: thiamine phosphate synthase [Bacteroidetes bacterium QH_9_67_14]|nr:MAG: thiamine phosphate synthase [Bacteroidetes bacterium QH_9_67_14]